MNEYYLLLLPLLLLFCIRVTTTAIIQTGHCQPLPLSTLCVQDIWNTTLLPNIRGQTDPLMISKELNDYLPLVHSECSNAIVIFLCSVYLPYCTNTNKKSNEIIVLQPCRHVCQYVKGQCESLYIRHGLSWPAHLECDDFPVTQPCFNVTELEDITIPSYLLTAILQYNGLQPDTLTTPKPSTLASHSNAPQETSVIITPSSSSSSSSLNIIPITSIPTSSSNTLIYTSTISIASLLELYTINNDYSTLYSSREMNGKFIQLLILLFHSFHNYSGFHYYYHNYHNSLIASCSSEDHTTMISVDSDLLSYPMATVTMTTTERPSSSFINMPLSLSILIVYGVVLIILYV